MTTAHVPAVVAPGCVDMVNFGAPESVPEHFEGRNFYMHNPQVTLMRTNADECARIGQIIANKANANEAPVVIFNPLKAVSEINAEGKAFYDPEADKALFSAIREHAKIEVIDMDETINSPAFARACAERLLQLMERSD